MGGTEKRNLVLLNLPGSDIWDLSFKFYFIYIYSVLSKLLFQSSTQSRVKYETRVGCAGFYQFRPETLPE